MIQLEHITLRRGIEDLLVDASLAVHAGQKIGLVGPNGCGKSSLFAMLLGDLDPDTGEVRIVTVPMHSEDKIPTGTLHSIADQCGADDFHAWCEWIDENC